MSLLACIGVFLLQACAGLSPEARYAEELLEKQMFDGAVAAYREAIKNDPFNAELQTKLEEAKTQAAGYHYGRGRTFLKSKQLPEALQEFQIALGLDPTKSAHHVALGDAVRLKNARTSLHDAEKLRRFGRLDEAMAAYERAIELDPSLVAAVEGLTSLVQDQQTRKKLGDSAEPVTLRFQSTRLKQVFEILARAANINILFEKDVRDDLVTIFTKDTPFDEALNLILTTNRLFAKRVSEDTLLVIPDTKQKRQQYQDLKIRTFYLTNAKAKDMSNLLRTILETKRIYVNEPLNTVVVRAEPEKIMLAEQIILANDRRDAEVVFDVEILEVNKNKRKRLGASFAKQIGAGFFPLVDGAASGTFGSASSFTMRQLRNLGSNSYLFTFPSSILLDFFKTESDAKTLANPQLRVLNNQKASINIGDKQPILLSTTNVNPGTDNALSSTSTVTSIEFKDTGIKLDVKPTIHLTDEITIELKIEVTRLGDLVRLQSDPIIEQFRFGTRTAETTLNLKDGETVVLAGLIQEEDRKTRESVPGIDDIPIIEDLFFNQKDKITTEVILAITPRLVRSLTTPSIVKQTLWSGTAERFATQPLFSKPEPVSIPPVLQSQPATTAVMASARMFVVPSSVSAQVGETVRMNIMAEDLPVLETTQLTMTYNSDILEFIQALPGDDRQADEKGRKIAASANPQSGHIVIRLEEKGELPIENGLLARVEFKVKASGSSPLMLQPPTILDSTGHALSVTAEQGMIQVQ